MNARNDRAKLLGNWCRSANADLKAAEQILRLKHDCPLNVVCFHAQQSTEKNLKAVLISMGIEFPKTHDIGELVALLPAGVTFPLSLDEQERLTDYAVSTRYPGDMEPVSRAETEDALVAAKRVQAAMRRLMATTRRK